MDSSAAGPLSGRCGWGRARALWAALGRRAQMGSEMERAGTGYVLEVNPKIPKRLNRLEELANDLWYGWDRHARPLFARVHPAPCDATRRTPKVRHQRVRG